MKYDAQNAQILYVVKVFLSWIYSNQFYINNLSNSLYIRELTCFFTPWMAFLGEWRGEYISTSISITSKVAHVFFITIKKHVKPACCQ